VLDERVDDAIPEVLHLLGRKFQACVGHVTIVGRFWETPIASACSRGARSPRQTSDDRSGD
jgi:hypothetical protein